jgi:ribosomal protein S18 acetylase RimI-like enzyme
VVDGTVAGFLTVQRHFEQAAEITWMAVHARHRHRGVGSALVERLCRTWPRRVAGCCWC